MNKNTIEAELLNRRFNRDAELFEEIYQSDLGGFNSWFNRAFRKPIYERFEIAIQRLGNVQGKKIIDIGCGTGIYMTTLGAKGAHRILGIDLSNEMLKLAQQKILESNLQSSCELLNADFLNINLNEKFDYSLAMGVFDYLSDPLTFMKKLRSITTDTLIASFPCNSLIRGPMRKLRYLLTTRGNVYYYTRHDIGKMVSQCGFSQYELVPVGNHAGFVLVAKVSNNRSQMNNKF